MDKIKPCYRVAWVNMIHLVLEGSNMEPICDDYEMMFLEYCHIPQDGDMGPFYIQDVFETTCVIIHLVFGIPVQSEYQYLLFFFHMI